MQAAGHCGCMRTYTCMCVYVFMCMQAAGQRSVYIHTRMIYICIRIYVYAGCRSTLCMHAYTYIYEYVFMCMQAAGQRWLVPRLRNRGDVGRERHGQDDLHQNVGWSPPVRRRGEGPQARREIQVYTKYICIYRRHIYRICTEYMYKIYRVYQIVGWSPPVRRRGEGPQARREIQVYIIYICINRICTEYKYNMYRVYIEYIYTEHI